MLMPVGDVASTEPAGTASVTSVAIRQALRSSSLKSGFAADSVWAVIAGLAAPSTVTAIDSVSGIRTSFGGGEIDHTLASCWSSWLGFEHAAPVARNTVVAKLAWRSHRRMARSVASALVEAVLTACRAARDRGYGTLVVLTGAGVSAESGIPTFRGKDGYWTVGAREYHPQELATHAAFARMPWEVWAWYLYRRTVCRRAEPNAGHLALARLAAALPDRVALVTQNVDGLHRRAAQLAGGTGDEVLAIHGDIQQMRCARDCVPDRWQIPDAVPDLGKGEPVPEAARSLLVCGACGGMARPHVLWFDESYDEERYHLDTVRALAAEAALVVVAGTSAQTNLPWQVVTLGQRSGATIVDINLEDNPFGEIAQKSGGVVRGPAAAALTAIVDRLVG